jgi:hypothetical protein
MVSVLELLSPKYMDISNVLLLSACVFWQYWGFGLRASHLLGRSSLTKHASPVLCWVFSR